MVVEEYSNVLTDSNSKKDLDPIFLEYALPFFLLLTSLILRKCLILSLSQSFSLSPPLPSPCVFVQINMKLCMYVLAHTCEP